MKKKISELIVEGKSKKEILVFFEERYGEWILRNPKKAGFNVSLWLLPFGAILAAVFLVGWFLKKKRNVLVIGYEISIYLFSN